MLKKGGKPVKKRPGIDWRIGRLSALLIDGGHVDRLTEFIKELVDSRRPIRSRKTTRELAKKLLPYVIRARREFSGAEEYLRACLTAKEASQFIPPLYPYEEGEEGDDGEHGC